MLELDHVPSKRVVQAVFELDEVLDLIRASHDGEMVRGTHSLKPTCEYFSPTNALTE